MASIKTKQIHCAPLPCLKKELQSKKTKYSNDPSEKFLLYTAVILMIVITDHNFKAQ